MDGVFAFLLLGQKGWLWHTWAEVQKVLYGWQWGAIAVIFKADAVLLVCVHQGLLQWFTAERGTAGTKISISEFETEHS